jgi:hypothetical protein
MPAEAVRVRRGFLHPLLGVSPASRKEVDVYIGLGTLLLIIILLIILF